MKNNKNYYEKYSFMQILEISYRLPYGKSIFEI